MNGYGIFHPTQRKLDGEIAENSCSRVMAIPAGSLVLDGNERGHVPVTARLDGEESGVRSEKIVLIGFLALLFLSCIYDDDAIAVQDP
ncbi:MAG: hypothetical protein AB1756_05570 [Acidobacteriota bacterium]